MKEILNMSPTPWLIVEYSIHTVTLYTKNLYIVCIVLEYVDLGPYINNFKKKKKVGDNFICLVNMSSLYL